MDKKIVTNPEIMVGKPIIKGTRVTVEAILKRLAEGYTIKDILEEYSQLTEEDIKAALKYAAKIIEKQSTWLG